MRRHRRALVLLWSALRFTFRVLFILMLVVIPVPIGLVRYRPHRERKNPVTLVLKKE